MQGLGVCVIGAGDMGTTHLASWQTVPDVELVAVADPLEERATAAQEKFGVHACYSDYEAALAEPGTNVVSVCVPSYLHRPVSEAAMRRGYHVLCEKPLAITIEDGQAMIATAEESGVKFTVGFCKRFMPQIQKIRELVQAGAVGRPVMYRFVAGLEVRPKQWIMDRRYGGGPVIDMACHYFDQWRGIFGSEPQRIMAAGLTLSTGSPHLPGIDPEVDTTTISVQFESGDVGVLSLTWGLPPGVHTETHEDILGKDGIIRLEGADKLIVISENGQETMYDGLGTDIYALQVAHFADAIREDKPVAATGEDGLVALRVSHAALESIATGQAVTL